MNGPFEPGKEPKKPIGLAGWIGIIVLAIFLMVTIAYAIHAWTQLEGTEISGIGWLMLGLGVFFTTACGVILMGLVFYSSRKNYDR